jgi:hypothetical protein
MKSRYYAERDSDGEGWSVHDRTTGLPADLNGTRHQRVPGEDIDELVDMLNGVAARHRAVKRKAWHLRFRIRRDRYFARRDAGGTSWSVWDHTTGAQAEVSGSPTTGLSGEDADDLVDTLNRIEARRA